MGFFIIVSGVSLRNDNHEDLLAPSNLTETRTVYPPTASKTVLVVSTSSVPSQSLFAIFTRTMEVSKHSTDRVDSAIRQQKLIYCANSIQWHLQASADKRVPFSGFLNLVYSIW